MSGIPPLAGLCRYDEATVPGFTVDQSVSRFVRYAWIKKRAMETALYWLNPTPEWEIKEALSLHVYYDAEHAGMLRKRVTEMRSPPPDMDTSPSPVLDNFFDEILTAKTTIEKLIGLYGVLKSELLSTLQAHFDNANPLIDQPTRRLLRIIIIEEQECCKWGNAAISALMTTKEAQRRADDWTKHLLPFLKAAGGISGDDSPRKEQLPKSRRAGVFEPDFFPKRDERFEQQWNFVFPPHEVARTDGVPAEEKTLALMCKRTLEMDVPEAMARMIAEAKKQPWEYYLDMTRQLWDEARHAMMGSVYFESIGLDWKKQIPLHPGFSIRLNQHMTPLEAHAILYTIEQSLMPASTGKKYEWKTAREANDRLATLFQDFDWADEVLHAQIGRRWVTRGLNMSREEVIELGQKKATESERVLTEYESHAEQKNWWPDFVKMVLGKNSAVAGQNYGTSDPVYSGV